MIDLNRAIEANDFVKEEIVDMFMYHPWDEDKKARGLKVRVALENCYAVIIDNVPPGPDRSVALRKLREARMDCNSSITHGGKY
jgi:hypothetical protein